MGSVVLGKLALYWCTSCNLPVLGKRCGICHGSTLPVKHTPPGDVRPSFGKDQIAIRQLVDSQFGEGCGDFLIPSANTVIFNRIPDQDRMEEIIVSGIVVGNYRYVLGEGYHFILKREGALRLISVLSRSWVKVDDGAAEYIKKGTSVLAPGVIDADPGIKPGDEVVVLSENGELIGPGTAKLTGKEMAELKRGLCVRLRQKWKDIALPELYDKPGNWEDAVMASMHSLTNYEKDAVNFVNRTVERNSHLPIMVSLSGGKDSLAVLLLVLEAGVRPELLFLDTGLEFLETIESVHRTAEVYDLNLIVADAGDAFWENVNHFGPPGKDYRWCCKVCKLGPTARTIIETYPEGVLSFIGQRSYESMQRAKKSRVWENPWVPGQVGASPIQYWTALHIWLYIFWKRAEYNPLYELGLSRIGCWLCPASDQADFLAIQEVHQDGRKWQELLLAFANEHGFTEEWVAFGLWKWKETPGFVKDLMKRNNIEVRRKIGEGEARDVDSVGMRKTGEGLENVGEREVALKFELGEIYPSCTDEVTAEGMFTKPIAITRVARLLTILGDSEYKRETGLCSIGDSVTLTSEGGLSIKAGDRDELRESLGSVVDIVLRAEECVGCGICIARCSQGALFLNDENRVDLSPDQCIHCRKCLGKCPVRDFREDREFEV